MRSLLTVCPQCCRPFPAQRDCFLESIGNSLLHWHRFVPLSGIVPLTEYRWATRLQSGRKKVPNNHRFDSVNIILVIIDTLRYDFVSANGNDAIDTPNLDHLASESVAFDRAFAASYPTIPFRTDVITGRTGSPFHIWKPLPHSDWTFVESLKEAGYATQLIHGHTPSCQRRA